MEMNWSFSFFRDEHKKVIWEGNEKKQHFTRDIHFKELPANYDRLVRMTIEVVACTQFLGNLVDVAKMEGAELPCLAPLIFLKVTSLVHDELPQRQRLSQAGRKPSRKPQMCQ